MFVAKRIAKEIKEIAEDKTIKEDEKILKILETINKNASEYYLVTFLTHDEIYKLSLVGKDNNIEISFK